MTGLILAVDRKLVLEIERALAPDIQREVHLGGGDRGERDAERMNAGLSADHRLIPVLHAPDELDYFLSERLSFRDRDIMRAFVVIGNQALVDEIDQGEPGLESREELPGLDRKSVV